MSEVMQRAGASIQPEMSVEILVQRLQDLRTEIDEVLAVLARQNAAAPATQATAAAEPPAPNGIEPTADPVSVAELESALDTQAEAGPTLSAPSVAEADLAPASPADEAPAQDALTLLAGIDETTRAAPAAASSAHEAFEDISQELAVDPAPAPATDMDAPPAPASIPENGAPATAVVISFAAHQDIKKASPVTKAPARTRTRGRTLAKLAACLLALLAAAIVMADRGAWGSVSMPDLTFGLAFPTTSDAAPVVQEEQAGSRDRAADESRRDYLGLFEMEVLAFPIR